MISVVKVASYIANRYMKDFGERISEMKLHKLLYFTQRESLIRKDEPMFEEQFLAWRYGPVMVQIRNAYANDTLNDMPSDEFVEQYKEVFDFVFQNYARKGAWSLSYLSHAEFSWKNARKNLLPEQNGNEPLKIEDIRKDAERISMRRFLLDIIQQTTV
ncbi:MAG: DUF4065 domain-containing protein [bacterium]|nr:DUF4065 domain-containing protein [Candidatus Minthenecus merdequi]